MSRTADHLGRLTMGIPDSPTQNQAWERSMDGAALSLIRALSPALWKTLQEFGYSGGMDCLSVTRAWAKVLKDHGLRVSRLCAGSFAGSASDGGGYLRTPGQIPDGHAWLAVGTGLWLFDPTWAQYRRSGSPTLGRYRVTGGITFVEWRSERLAQRGQL
jgi:hypothetical protein